MNLGKAIENLESFSSTIDPMTQQWLIDSMTLGIEGLKQIESWRQDGILDDELPLPSETLV